MISSGHFGGGYLYVNINTTTNVPGNYSVVNWQVCLRRDGEWRAYAVKNGWIHINSQSYNFSCHVNGGVGNVILAQGSTNIGHNNDGSQTIYVAARLDCQITWSGSYQAALTLGDNVVLDKIPRGTTIQQFNVVSNDWRSITFHFKTKDPVEGLWVHKNNGDSIGTGIANSSDGNFTISGLEPHTSWSWKLRVRRNGVDTSTTITAGTKMGCSAWNIPNRSMSLDDNIPLFFDNSQHADLQLVIWMTCANSAGTPTQYQNVLAKNIGGIHGDYTWTFSAAERDALFRTMKYSNNGTIYLYVHSYVPGEVSTGKAIATLGCDINATIDTNKYKPTFTELGASLDTTTSSILGNGLYLIQNKSYVSLSAALSKMTAGRGADLKTLTFTNMGATQDYSLTNGVSTFSKTISNFSNTGAYRITAYITDSRGNKSTEIVKNYTVLSYHQPVIVPKVVRALSSGGKIDVSFTAAYSRLIVSSVDKNAVSSLKYGYSLLGVDPSVGTNITGYTSANASNGVDKNLTYNKSGLLTLDENKNYRFKFTLQDKLNTITVAVDLIDGNPLVRVLDTGQMGINTKPDTSNLNEKLRVGGDARILGGLTTTGTILGNQITSTNEIIEKGTSLSSKYAGLTSFNSFKSLFSVDINNNFADKGTTWQVYTIKYGNFCMLFAKCVMIIDVVNPWGAVYTSNEMGTDIPFPVTFVDDPVTITNTTNNGGDCWHIVARSATTTTGPRIKVIRGNGATITTKIQMQFVGQIVS